MAKTLHVGNLAPSVTEAALSELFSAYGPVLSVQLALDRQTGQPRGFALVEMASGTEARSAATALNLKEVDGRCMTVTGASPNSGRGRRRS